MYIPCRATGPRTEPTTEGRSINAGYINTTSGKEVHKQPSGQIEIEWVEIRMLSASVMDT